MGIFGFLSDVNPLNQINDMNAGWHSPPYQEDFKSRDSEIAPTWDIFKGQVFKPVPTVFD